MNADGIATVWPASSAFREQRRNMSAEPFDELVRCPRTGEPLSLCGDHLITPSQQRYEVDDGIPQLYVDEDEPGAVNITNTVREFYEEVPFPNYNDFDTIDTFLRRAETAVFSRLLSEQLPKNARVLEVGCGTGQLSNYLAATTSSKVYASDMTRASLRMGYAFARRNDIKNVHFLRMNLFKPAFLPASMDVVISNGVLHNTHDTRKAFLTVAPLVKPGGYILIGLYNHIGRLRTDLRRFWIKLLGRKVLFLDPQLRQNLSPAKREAWIRDQYFHPQERKHSISELIAWFREAGISFVSSLPKIRGSFAADEPLFEPQDPGTAFDRIVAETRMLTSRYAMGGGLFICIGRKAR
jgi:SAM-dependent methyltransferase